MTLVFIGGPRAGHNEHHIGPPIPSQRVPIYSVAHSGAVCDDEQVVHKEGHYERFSIFQAHAYYEWHPAGS